MAFPLQTQVLVDGQWVTRTVDTHTLLQHHNRMDDNAVDNTMDTIRPPVRGVLTQTIVQSPLVHWILPIRLQGQEYDDVAYIGVSGCPLVHQVLGIYIDYLATISLLLWHLWYLQERMVRSR